VSNVGALWIFGASVEDRMGRRRYLGFFLLSSVAAGLLDVVARAGSPEATIGASGAVAAVISAHFVLFPTSRALVLVPLLRSIDLVEVPTLLLVGFWLVFQTAGGAGLFVVLGGALTGALFVWMFRQPARETVEWWS
jgi:membrane associated rhomboid family serine protease